MDSQHPEALNEQSTPTPSVQSENTAESTSKTVLEGLPFNTTFEFASMIANLAEAKKAEDTAILDVSQVSSLADFFVITSAQSHTQIKATCQYIKEHFKQLGLMPLNYEEDSKGEWYLLDYGDVVVHVMRPDSRSMYDLETFWSHGHQMPREEWFDHDLPLHGVQSA